MKPAPRRWTLPQLDPTEGDLDILQRVMRARGLSESDLRLGQPGIRHDQRLLTDMERAVSLVADALQRQVPVAIYGDYDADGVTATALLVRALQAAGAQPLAHIPNRESEGYGLNLQALQELAAQGVGLVVTVDCGTTAVEVAAARPPNLQLVITDHHLPHLIEGTEEYELAAADALVNPQRPGDRYPFKGLAGVGVAYKLVQALEDCGLVPSGTASQQLPLVALGTVADMMPLVDENRHLVRQGLQTWAEAAPLGLLALARSAGIEGELTSADLGFALGPRLNAAGRMEDARLALACCLAGTPEDASRAAAELERLNRNRRAALAEALELARPMAEGLDDALPAIVIGDRSFPAGVVGLVAGRLAEEYQRPSFVFTMSGQEWRGSARGAPGLNVVEALAACSGQLLRYGGHRGAGGFSVRPDPQSAAAFTVAVSQAVAAQLGAREPCRVHLVDALVELAQCNLKLADELAVLGPFGISNPPVMLAALACEVVRAEPFGRNDPHLRVRLRDRSGQAEAITFNRPQLRRHLPEGRVVDVLFELDVNRFRGREQCRLMLRDLRPSQSRPAPGGSGA